MNTDMISLNVSCDGQCRADVWKEIEALDGDAS